jgi:alkaline phosphatase D
MGDALSRRSFLAIGSSALLCAAGSRLWREAGAAEAGEPEVFALGVASGDPTPSSAVLWTRLMGDPERGGEPPARDIAVHWEVAADPALQRVLRRGTALARAQSAHSVHVTAVGLAPDRWYWYRFRAGSAHSPIGRTRTLPPPESRPERLRFAFVSCQNLEEGYFTAYQNLLCEDLDFIVHLGDYVYEGAPHSRGPRRHQGGELHSLQDYRSRHAQYRRDPQLQAAHARFPFLCTWDDHEVENNFAGTISEANDIPERSPVSADVFSRRRANAYRAYYEHLPLAPAARPGLGGGRLFRSLRFGRLAELCLLDTRRYRSNQPCGGELDPLPPLGDDFSAPCGGEQDPAATLTGPAQERWLLERLASSPVRWRAIAQQVMMARVDVSPGGELSLLNMDAWDGYAAARRRLLGFVREHRVQNVVVLTGDIHSSWVADLRADFDAPGSPVVATEFVGTSISSHFAEALIPLVESALAHPSNAHVKFFDGRCRGYTRCEVREDVWRTDFRAVETVHAPSSAVRTLCSYAVHSGRAGAQRLGGAA